MSHTQWVVGTVKRFIAWNVAGVVLLLIASGAAALLAPVLGPELAGGLVAIGTIAFCIRELNR